MGDWVRNPAHGMRRTATSFGSTWGGQDFTKTGVNHEDGSLVTGEVERNNGFYSLVLGSWKSRSRHILLGVLEDLGGDEGIPEGFETLSARVRAQPCCVT